MDIDKVTATCSANMERMHEKNRRLVALLMLLDNNVPMPSSIEFDRVQWTSSDRKKWSSISVSEFDSDVRVYMRRSIEGSTIETTSRFAENSANDALKQLEDFLLEWDMEIMK